MIQTIDTAQRLRMEVRGAVQGVGFRPFVYRLASELGLNGWISNGAEGVLVEVEGPGESLWSFALRLRGELPPHAAIHEIRESWLDPVGLPRFEIRGSAIGGKRSALMQPDLATCPRCRDELFDAENRRHGYPFTNCTDCGPRFSIIRTLPYDRPNTSMAGFRLCGDCAAEYRDPADRRFHAQPNACPVCGPRLAVWDMEGAPLERGSAADAIATVVDALGQGLVVAVKSLGGFHLMADARSEVAVNRLRARKGRPTKPLAVMVAGADALRRICEVTPEAEALLESPRGPIVLLPRLEDAGIARAVAPGSTILGVMLPPTPLHHLLAVAAGYPLVATSGNLSEEPICTDEREAVLRLGGIADLFLVHDRPIVRHVDDSVAQMVLGEPYLVRRARGYAPLPVRLKEPAPTILALGGHLKSTVALAIDHDVFLSQHIGDLDGAQAIDTFDRVVRDLLCLYEAEPCAIAHDLHPDYASTQWAEATLGHFAGAPRLAVQHHHAHLVSCLAENRVTAPALGVVWDGSGLGPDGTIWGGEFLVGDAFDYRRVASLLPFRLPGGDVAAREPFRVALALAWEALGEDALDDDELPALRALPHSAPRIFATMIRQGIQSPVTTSVGRLFDGVAALAGLRQTITYEGEAAILLEQVADPVERGAYEIAFVPGVGDGPMRLDWRGMIGEIRDELRDGTPLPLVSARFHNALVQAIVSVAMLVGEERVALSGGVFQNRLLVERTAAALRRAGLEVLLHRQVPPNDGGLCLGQVAVAAARLAGGGS
jgi:hydrogenase maturation protein HypF